MLDLFRAAKLHVDLSQEHETTELSAVKFAVASGPYDDILVDAKKA